MRNSFDTLSMGIVDGQIEVYGKASVSRLRDELLKHGYTDSQAKKQAFEFRYIIQMKNNVYLHNT